MLIAVSYVLFQISISENNRRDFAAQTNTVFWIRLCYGVAVTVLILAGSLQISARQKTPSRRVIAFLLVLLLLTFVGLVLSFARIGVSL